MKTYIRLSGISGSPAKQPSALSLADWPRHERQFYLTRSKQTYTVRSADTQVAVAPVRTGWRSFFSHARRLRDVLLAAIVFAVLAGAALAQPKNETTAVGPLTLSAEQLQWLIAKMTMRQNASLGTQSLSQKGRTSGAATQNQASAVGGNAAAPKTAANPVATANAQATPAQNEAVKAPVAPVESADMPDIRFTAVDGRVVDLVSLRGKVVLIDFWATWCGPCMAEIPNVVKTYNQYHEQGFEIVGISFDTSEAALQQVTAAKNMPWPQYFDGKGWQNSFGVKYGIRSIPTMWLIDQQGRIVTKNARANLAEQVAKLLTPNGSAIETPEVRATATAPVVVTKPVTPAAPAEMPDIRFTAVDGREVDLASLRGKVVLIDFWATWCGPCMAEIPNVVNTYNKYHEQGFEIIGISFDTSKASLQRVTQAKDMPWPQYYDGKGWQNVFGVKYGIRGIPTMWLIDQEGRLVTKNARQNLAGQVEKLLATGGAN
jgi:peroxiredoxin